MSRRLIVIIASTKGSHFYVSLSLPHFCPAANRPGFTYEHLLPGDTSSHVIDSLEEDKKYTISIYAIFPQGPSEPVAVVGKTCKSKRHNDVHLPEQRMQRLSSTFK